MSEDEDNKRDESPDSDTEPADIADQLNDPVFDPWKYESALRAASIVDYVDKKFDHRPHEFREKIKDALLDKGIRHIHWFRESFNEAEFNKKVFGDGQIKTAENRDNSGSKKPTITDGQLKYLTGQLITNQEEINEFESWCENQKIEIHGTAKKTLEVLTKEQASNLISHMKEFKGWD